MRIVLIYLTLLCFSTGCKKRPKSISEGYDDIRLKEYLIKISAIQKTDIDSVLIVFLQNVDCICTDSHIDLVTKLFNSAKYRSFKKILLVQNKDHKIFKKNLPADMIWTFNEDGKFEKNGIISTTDRVLVYDDHGLALNFDLHTERDLSGVEKSLGL